ncbi:MAG TPA: hypothetical protein VGK31_08725 [Thermoanaerobaculia bacterium]|jgi:hypothetical protein
MKRTSRIAIGVSAAFAAYPLALLTWRKWHRRWGATDDEAKGHLPGDELARGGFRCTHAITIRAPRSEVWKWLVQIGQDRAGFYSYSILENAFLADIHNADRIEPAWQELRAGQYVRLASKNNYGDVPLLRVLAIEPNHYFVLEHWGAFVLEEIDAKTTRLIIRTHRDKPMGGALLHFLFWEPAHFIMEYGMLHGIKSRAERAA